MAIISANSLLGTGLVIVPGATRNVPDSFVDPVSVASFDGSRATASSLFRYDFTLADHPVFAEARVFAFAQDRSTWRSLDFVKVTYLTATGQVALTIDEIGQGVASVPGSPKPSFEDMAAQGVGIMPLMSGHDEVTGTNLADRVHGFDGHDLLQGRGGRDQLFGNAGDDTLEGGGSRDRLRGNNGSDEFLFSASGNGRDVIVDFNELDGGSEEGDRIVIAAPLTGTFIWRGDLRFTGGSDNTEARVKGQHVLIDLNGDGRADINITLEGLTSASQIAAGDFLFL